MAVTYRLARITDIQAVSDVYWESILDVYQRHGFEDRRPSYPVNPFYAFCLQEEPSGFFVAEEGTRLVGAAFSWVRGHLWFLSHLFISPSCQGRGIGRTLLELTLQYGITAGATLKAVITMAFNPVSLALYMKAGLHPIQDIYLMKTTIKPVLPKGPTLVCERQGPLSWQGGDLDTLDIEALAMPRQLHHRFYLGLKDASCILFRLGGRVEAYAYLWKDGRIGPVSALADSPYDAILHTVMEEARQHCDDLSLLVPGSNGTAMKFALSRGFTVIMPYVLLSSESFGRWDHYLFHSPGMM
jgi:GNAT superfamily N-acetyltransferase